MQIKLFISATAVSYTCHPQPLRRGLIKTLSVGSFPPREVMRGWAGYFFVCVLWEPLFILKHVLQGSSTALIVWSERALLSPGSDIMRVSSVHTISSGLLETTRARNSTTNSADSFCTHGSVRSSEGWQGGRAVRRVGMLGGWVMCFHVWRTPVSASNLLLSNPLMQLNSFFCFLFLIAELFNGITVAKLLLLNTLSGNDCITFPKYFASLKCLLINKMTEI